MKDTEYGKRALINYELASAGGAVLSILKGDRTNMHFHLDHEKLVYVIAGTLRAWIIKGGNLIPTVVNAGADFYVRRGLVHQFEGVTDVVLVEFVCGATDYDEDDVVVAKFKKQEQPDQTGELAKMTPEDGAKVEEKVEEVAEPTPTKKTPKRKKTTKKTAPKKKKTVRKTSKRRSN